MMSGWRPGRASLTLLLLSAAVVAATHTLRIIFLPDVVAIADTDEPRSFWVLQAAFLLQTLENIGAMGALLVLAAAVAHWLGSFSPIPRK
jgi:hypothetical protein